MTQIKKLKILKDLSIGKVLRTEKDWWLTAGEHVTYSTEQLKGGQLLIQAEASLSGMVGESIVCYSYALLNLKNLQITPITSVEQYRVMVYPYQFKAQRIFSWAAMRNGTLFGWSEDPRPYVE